MTHIFISGFVSIGSGNGLLPVLCWSITWTNTGLLSIGPPGTLWWIQMENFFFQENTTPVSLMISMSLLLSALIHVLILVDIMMMFTEGYNIGCIRFTSQRWCHNDFNFGNNFYRTYRYQSQLLLSIGPLYLMVREDQVQLQLKLLVNH